MQFLCNIIASPFWSLFLFFLFLSFSCRLQNFIRISSSSLFLFHSIFAYCRYRCTVSGHVNGKDLLILLILFLISFQRSLHILGELGLGGYFSGISLGL